MKIRQLAVLFTLFTCSFAYAGSSACGTATVVIPDGRILDFDNVQANTTNWYAFTATANRSYSIEVHDDLDADPSGDLTIKVYTPTSTCSSLTAATNTTDTHAIEPAAPVSGKRLSIVTTASGSTGGGVYLISVQNTNASLSHYLSMKVDETTIYGWNWSTYAIGTAQFYNQFTVFNSTSQSVTFTLTLTAVTGGSGTYTTGSVALSGQSYLAYASNQSPLSVPNNEGGIAVLTHNGPPGALEVYAVSIESSTTPAIILPFPMTSLRNK